MFKNPINLLEKGDKMRLNTSKSLIFWNQKLKISEISIARYQGVTSYV